MSRVGFVYACVRMVVGWPYMCLYVCDDIGVNQRAVKKKEICRGEDRHRRRDRGVNQRRDSNRTVTRTTPVENTQKNESATEPEIQIAQ